MRLLLAEDERSLSRALVRILEDANYSVDPVYDGRAAIDYIENGAYDGAILDIMMPEVDGLSVLKTIRQKGISLPVIMLTAKSGIEDRVAGLDQGANDYLTKPFAPQELLARIRAMTRDSSNQTDNWLHQGNISLDTATAELTGPGGKFRLTNKEYQMMEMLLRNGKQLIPTERFFEKIWGYDSDAEINVVWVYISYLRKKLRSLRADIAITASRNSGYYISEIKKEKKV